MDLEKQIIYSLKQVYADQILNKTKKYEFRSIKPKILPKRIWFYISSPVSELTFIAEVGEIIEAPNKILESSKYKFAYPILHFYKLKNPISLEKLKRDYKFSPPQSFSYLGKYPKLAEEINNPLNIIKIF